MTTGSPLPDSWLGLRQAGYVFKGHGTCRSANCKAPIQWWLTPAKRYMPIDNGDKPEPHWATCPDSKNFKR